MKRREFIALLGSTAALSWHRSARAQSSEHVRRIGVLMHAAADEAEAQARLAAFLQGLQRRVGRLVATFGSIRDGALAISRAYTRMRRN